MVNSIIVESSTELQNAEPLGRLSVLSYGAGHMLNDVTSACWFTYLLLFLTDIGLSPRSMVNCITLNPTSRVALASCRNAFTMVSNLSLYAIALAVFSVYNAKQSADVKIQYRWIAYLSIFIGCCFVGIFLMGTKEPELKLQVQCKGLSRISWAHWFKKVLYYQVALVYMLTRLITNVSQALFAFYVIDDLKMNHSSKALVPAIIYICSFMVSVILQEIRWTGWRLKAFFTGGAIFWIFSGAGIFILPSKLQSFMYILSITIGVANALMTACLMPWTIMWRQLVTIQLADAVWDSFLQLARFFQQLSHIP